MSITLSLRPHGNVNFAKVLDENGSRIYDVFVVQVVLPRTTLVINNTKVAYYLNGEYWKRNPSGDVVVLYSKKQNVLPM